MSMVLLRYDTNLNANPLSLLIFVCQMHGVFWADNSCQLGYVFIFDATDLNSYFEFTKNNQKCRIKAIVGPS